MALYGSQVYRTCQRILWAKPLYVQDKMVLVIIKDAISFHLSKFQGQATALDAKIICKLLS